MDDDHCVITTQHRICEIPIAADKRQFSVFVYMSAACGFTKRRCKYKENDSKCQKKKKTFSKTRIAFTAMKKRFHKKIWMDLRQ